MDVPGAIRDYLINNCNYSDSWLHIVYALIVFSPTVLTFIFAGVSYYTKQIFYLFMSMALYVDSLLNLLVSNWIPWHAPVETCGGPRAFPSFFMQHSAFLITFLLLSRHVFKLHISPREIWLLQIWLLLTWVSAVDLGYNNFKQVLSGAIVGSTLAAACILLLYMTIGAIRLHILHDGLLHRLGYIDSIFVTTDSRITLAESQLRSLIAAAKKGDDIVWGNLLVTYGENKHTENQNK